MNLADDPGGVARILCRGVDRRRLCNVDQIMWNAAAGTDGKLVGADVESPVYGRGIAIEDFATVALGQGQAERALARRCRAKDGEDDWTRIGVASPLTSAHHPTRISTYTTRAANNIRSPSSWTLVGIYPSMIDDSIIDGSIDASMNKRMDQ